VQLVSTPLGGSVPVTNVAYKMRRYGWRSGNSAAGLRRALGVVTCVGEGGVDIYTQWEDQNDALANLREAAQLHIEEVGVGNLWKR